MKLAKHKNSNDLRIIAAMRLIPDRWYKLLKQQQQMKKLHTNVNIADTTGINNLGIFDWNDGFEIGNNEVHSRCLSAPYDLVNMTHCWYLSFPFLE